MEIGEKGLKESLVWDINPKHWLLKFRKTSVTYLIIMLLFYHALGFSFLVIGSAIIGLFNNSVEQEPIALSLIGVLTAGPIEESIFYGIPWYLTNNNMVVLFTGLAWSFLHLFNTEKMGIENLSYANWLFVIPSIFFSLRTWSTGKGWFAILSHSVWNIIFFSLSCVNSETLCTIIPNSVNLMEIQIIVFATSLLIADFLLYKWRSKIV